MSLADRRPFESEDARPRLSVAARREVDEEAAGKAIGDLLTALGVNVDDEQRARTARRAAAAFAELLRTPPFEPTTFPNEEGYDELVIARDIPFHSLCQDHLMPFIGVAHVGYLPAERILGLSKLARVVEHFARTLQTQERLTAEVADWLARHVEGKGVGVVLVGRHTCVSLRGVRKPGSRVVTSALRGLVRDDPGTRREFLAAAGLLGGSTAD